MIWLTFRQQRLETRIGGGVVALVAALLRLTGLDMHAVFQHTGVSRPASPAACRTRCARAP